MTPEGEERLPALRGYMVFAIVIMAVKLIQVTTHKQHRAKRGPRVRPLKVP